MRLPRLIFVALLAAGGWARDTATIRVNAAESPGPFKPIYAFFGYDEPNYTYTKNGRKLIGELAALSRAPVYIRTHFLLASGDGTPDLKWGSTNAYTEDGSGRPLYDWSITDRIFDAYLEAGAKPFVEIGFMPRALSAQPDPYRVAWIPGGKNERYGAGWSYPPKDYARWGDLVHAWVRHAAEKYGPAEVASWYWEVWNEPDIFYWRGTPEEYDKLYDYTADAVKRALPAARIGGPAVTGPGNERAAKYLRRFLEHCSSGKNSVTGGTGAPLDFITYHAKGRTSAAGGRLRMDISQNARDVERGFEIVRAFPKFRNLPVVLSESDPEGCAACPARVYPQNAYRDGALYPAYTAAMLGRIFKLADRSGANIEGMLTWAFEFEGQPYFDGFRALATNGIDKPVLNLFRMAGLMEGRRVKTERAGAASGESGVDALAARSDREISVLVWNYSDDATGGEAAVRLEIAGLPSSSARLLVRHYRIDDEHSNAWTAWKKMGSPQPPSPAQYAELEAAGQLQELESPRWVTAPGGEAAVEFTLPRPGVALIQIVQVLLP